jgi:hypothetical protein
MTPRKATSMADLYREAWDATYDPEELADIEDIEINPEMPWPERMKKYLQNIRNPYVYKCGKMVVRERYNPNGKSLDEAITAYLSSIAESRG